MRADGEGRASEREQRRHLAEFLQLESRECQRLPPQSHGHRRAFTTMTLIGHSLPRPLILYDTLTHSLTRHFFSSPFSRIAVPDNRFCLQISCIGCVFNYLFQSSRAFTALCTVAQELAANLQSIALPSRICQLWCPTHKTNRNE